MVLFDSFKLSFLTRDFAIAFEPYMTYEIVLFSIYWFVVL